MHSCRRDWRLSRVVLVQQSINLNHLHSVSAKMSDYEDEMDVDVPAPSKDIAFSSDNTAKGKRSAANLPIEAEDSLPWYVPSFSAPNTLCCVLPC